MSRFPRLDYPGAIQYICIHGVSTQPLFTRAEDFEFLEHIIVESISLYQIKLHLYCLLPDQVHIAIETPQGNIAEVMHRITTRYTIYFNRAYQRRGPLLQGRFISLIVENDLHLLRLSRWIHLLPLTLLPATDQTNRRKLSALRRFQRTSFRAYTGLIPQQSWLTTATILRLAKRYSTVNYSRYVREGVLKPDAAFNYLMTRARMGIGSPRFINEHLRALVTNHPDYLTPTTQRTLATPAAHTPFTVIRTLCRICSVPPSEIRRRQRQTYLRPLTAWALNRFARMTQQQIASELHIATSAAISVQLRTLATQADTDPQLRAIMTQIESALS